MKYLWHKGPFISGEIIRFQKSILAMTCSWISLRKMITGTGFEKLFCVVIRRNDFLNPFLK